MKAKWLGALLAALTIAATVAPAPAQAKPGYFVFPGYRESRLTVKGTHGFAIAITRTGHRVELRASDGNAAAIYIVPSAELSRDGIKATFPGLGRVSVEFHSAGTAKRTSGFFPDCKGGDTVSQPGYFQGTIRFRGERGYTAVDATRVSGKVVSASKEICKRTSGRGDSEPNPTEHLTMLSAYSKSASGAVAFTALEATSGLAPARDWIVFFALDTERRRGMVISRSAFATAKRGAFTLGDTADLPISATITPPEPFHGSAGFQRNPDSTAWTGSLNVALPGLGRVALAGSDFSASLCRDSGCDHSRSKTAVIVSQGRGSQSQAFWDARLSWSR